MSRTNNYSPIPKDIRNVEKYLKKHLGIDISYDVGLRKLSILKSEIQIYYVNGLVDAIIVGELVKTLVEVNDHEPEENSAYEVIENRLINLQVETIESMDEAIDETLTGLIVIFIDGHKEAFVVDVRNYPGRTPEEPDTERVIRGSRDGYTENIVQNTSLTRRRVRDGRLRNVMTQVGERSKTDVCVSYLQDVADDGLVKLIKEKLEEIEIDGIPMADKTIEEFIVSQKWNAYPLVRYTERPDMAAKHLLEGRVLIIVDTSPSVIILPATFFDHMEHAEEYRQSPTVGTFIRFIRNIAVLSSLYLLPLWFLFVQEPNLLPESLSFIGPNEEGNIPIIIQIILAVLGMQFLRMAAIHTPTPLATAMGLIAAVLIGEIAVEVGMFSPEVILYVAISTVGTYVTPSYELSVANKLMEIFLLVATALFGSLGFIVGITVSILYLANIKALETPYLWPFMPFNATAFLQTVFRIPIPYANVRPTIVNPKNIYSQPVKKR